MPMPKVDFPISTYGGLKKAVSLWADRDDPEFVEQIPNFIDFGQKEIYRNLRIPTVSKEVYLSIKDGTCHIPPDFLEAQWIMRAKTGQLFKLIGPEEMSALRENGIGKHDDTSIKFARFGNRWLFYPLIDADTPVYPDDGAPEIPAENSVILSYYADPPELVNDSDTSAILTIAPELLLYFALRHASLFVQDNEGAEKWSALGTASLEEIVHQAKASEWKGSPLAIPKRGFDKIYRSSHRYGRW